MDVIKSFTKQQKAFKALDYVVPEIQRSVNNNTVDEIYKKEAEFYSIHGSYLLGGVVAVCIIRGDNSEYLIDGQHRMSAYARLSREFPEREMIIHIDQYTCDNKEALEQIYKMVNTSQPNDISRMSVGVYKLKHEISEFLRKQFPAYLKTSARPQPPNINLELLQSKLDQVPLGIFASMEFCKQIILLNKFYSEVPYETFAKWRVERKHVDAVKQKANQMFLGIYKEFEWVDRIVQAKTNNTPYSEMVHYSSTYREKITKLLRRAVWDSKSTEKTCYCCGDTIYSDTFHCGHVIPVSKGGETKKENLRAICAGCNGDMGTMNLEEYKELITVQCS